MSKSNSNDQTRLSRRRALILPAAGLGAAMALEAAAAEGNKTASAQASASCSTPRSAVAKTQYGKVCSEEALLLFGDLEEPPRCFSMGLRHNAILQLS